MKHTVMAMATTMDQHVRNQLSLMAWIMTALCGWAMFLSAHAITTTNASAGENDAYTTLSPSAQK